jgi:NDP-sugar pyrophosphorylase family protein
MNCKIENAYIGPYTSIGDNTEIIDSSIEYSVVLDHVLIKGVKRLEESIIGGSAKILKETGDGQHSHSYRRLFRVNSLARGLQRKQHYFSKKSLAAILQHLISFHRPL